MGILGWVKPEILVQVQNSIKDKLSTEPRNFLLLAFEGTDKESPNKVHGRIWCEGKVFFREARAKCDEAKHWYIHLENPWRQL